MLGWLYPESRDYSFARSHEWFPFTAEIIHQENGFMPQILQEISENTFSLCVLSNCNLFPLCLSYSLSIIEG